MCNISHMTFIFKCIIAFMNLNMQDKNIDAASGHSRVIVLTDIHTYIHIDTSVTGP